MLCLYKLNRNITWNQNFKKIHTNLPDLLSKFAAKNNIEKFIIYHPRYWKIIDSNYAHKLEGENKIKNNFERSVILNLL